MYSSFNLFIYLFNVPQKSLTFKNSFVTNINCFRKNQLSNMHIRVNTWKAAVEVPKMKPSGKLARLKVSSVLEHACTMALVGEPIKPRKRTKPRRGNLWNLSMSVYLISEVKNTFFYRDLSKEYLKKCKWFLLLYIEIKEAKRQCGLISILFY